MSYDGKQLGSCSLDLHGHLFLNGKSVTIIGKLRL